MKRLKSLGLGLLTALTLTSPALATSIPSVASGEAADREAALTSALRHAVEQVVGMSVETSTYVSNLKNLQDKVYTGATGYIESYDVVDEQHTSAGYRITVSAQVSKEKLTSVVSTFLGDGAIKLDGKLAVANLKVRQENQKEAERTLKGLLDELSGSALKITFDTPRSNIGTDNPNLASIYLDNFRVEIDESWYKRYRDFCKSLTSYPFSNEVFRHAIGYASYFSRELGSWENGRTHVALMVVDLYDEAGNLITTTQNNIDSVSPAGETDGALFNMSNLATYLPGPIIRPSTAEFRIPLETLKHVSKIRVRNCPFRQ